MTVSEGIVPVTTADPLSPCDTTEFEFSGIDLTAALCSVSMVGKCLPCMISRCHLEHSPVVLSNFVLNILKDRVAFDSVMECSLKFLSMKGD